MARKYPIGAELLDTQGAHFRVWAPKSKTVAVELFDAAGKSSRTVSLAAESGGYFSGQVREAGVGARYKFKLDHGSFPDPASFFQPEGPHGPSAIPDPAFAWTDHDWRGRPAKEWVIYELHLGTFTPEGTWRAAMAQLPELARLGITVIEIMPIAEFPGKFGWGYDGVDFFAPSHLYGTPNDVRAFINRAHELGVMVILDVVYNHFGPDGNYVGQYSGDYFSRRYKNEWGDPLNFDDENSDPVREFFRTNAVYWIREFHFDGLRLDATQQIYDASPTHILTEIAAAARAAAPGRTLCIVAENECQHARLVRPAEAGGNALDAIWNDDFHHAALVAATGHAEAYYSDYRGRAQEFVSAAKYGFLFQGQWYHWQKQRRGRAALDLRPHQFVHFLENHDQVANSVHGLRLHQLAAPGQFRALTALLLLGPQVPMLFQGQEFGASQRFVYFADHGAELAKLVASGRREFLTQFRSAATEEVRPYIPDPGAEETFQRCRLDFAERTTHEPIYRLHQDLLALRRNDPTIHNPARIDGAVLDDRAFVLRLFGARPGAERLLVVNFGADLRYDPAPEPLLAPPDESGWRLLWSSQSPLYGGRGTAAIETTSNWMIPGHAAVLLGPDHNNELPHARLSQTD